MSVYVYMVGATQAILDILGVTAEDKARYDEMSARTRLQGGYTEQEQDADSRRWEESEAAIAADPAFQLLARYEDGYLGKVGIEWVGPLLDSRGKAYGSTKNLDLCVQQVRRMQNTEGHRALDPVIADRVVDALRAGTIRGLTWG
jgi:hypothetical protein